MGRVFVDVPYEHPMCVEIESLYRDGLTRGCRVEDGERHFCPDQPLTRAMGAVFAEHRDAFAQISSTGRIQIGDHVANAERVETGIYWVQFRRDIQHCSREGWSHDRTGPGVRVKVRRLSPTIDTVLVETTVNEVRTDMWFNVRIHCR